MLPLHNGLTNDDPLSKWEQILALRDCWYCQFFLITSNLFGIAAIYTLFRLGFSIVGVSVLIAVVDSIGYHMCQSMGSCFLSNLFTWTIIDHISAPAMLAMIVIFTINSRSAAMIRATHRALLSKMMNEVKTLDSAAGLPQVGEKEKNGEEDGSVFVGVESSSKYNYYYSQVYIEENTTYDAWSATIVYVYIFVAIQATLNHPFSMQAFLIVISFGLGAVFFKIIVIDGGDISDTAKRISIPELVIGVVLIGISLIFFVLDGIFPDQYWILHSLWHALSFTGVYFYALGITKNTPNWYSPYGIVKRRVRQLFRTHSRTRNFRN